MAENERVVRVLTDLKTFAYETVPISRVPPGYVPIHFRDRGDFYAKPTGLAVGEYQHPPFPPKSARNSRSITPPSSVPGGRSPSTRG